MNAPRDNSPMGEILPEDEIQTLGVSSPLVGEEAQAADAGEAEDNPQAAEPSEDQTPPRKYAGVYKSVEDLEKGYKELQAEYTRLRQAMRHQEEQAIAPQATQHGEQTQAPNPLAEEVAQLRNELEWQKLERQYGPEIRQEVIEYFQQLSPEEQMALDNPAGARLVAKLVRAGKSESPQPMQPTGASKSHVAPKPRLTRAEILNMSPEEYARRQAEIMQFYASQAEG